MKTEVESSGPLIVAPYRPERGGVDFLGMRQVNIDMMANCWPGINNVTWFVRPFSVVSWIYWKFRQLAEREGLSQPSGEHLRVWKEKVETLFTWGHKIKGIERIPGTSFDPPGAGAVPLDFDAWGRTAVNTSLMAAIQYGPAAKTIDGLGFLEPVWGGFFRTVREGIELAEALDRAVARHDSRGLVAKLGPSRATAQEAEHLFPSWSVYAPAKKEQEAFRRAFFDFEAIGEAHPLGRRSTSVQLVLWLLERARTPLPVPGVRSLLFHGRPSNRGDRIRAAKLVPGWIRWIVLQVRQAQRLAMEGLLSWFETRLLQFEERGSDRIARSALAALRGNESIVPNAKTVRECYEVITEETAKLDDLLQRSERDPAFSIFSLMDTLNTDIRTGLDRILPYALRILFLCARFTELLTTQPGAKVELQRGRADRLSLAFWADALDHCGGMPFGDFLRFLFENLILSQHFSVATRRFDGQTQRLRISIEEEGLSFLADKPLIPSVTPDRLATALALMADCGLLAWDDGAEGYYIR